MQRGTFVAVLIFFFATDVSIAQSAYLKGYVVYSTGDTSQAYIHFNPADPPVTSVEMRTSPAGKDEEVPVSDLKCFWLPNYGNFTAFTVPLSVPNTISGTSRYWNEVGPISGFLQEIVIGDTFSLYKLGNMRYYLRRAGVKEDNGFEELIFLDFEGCCRYDIYQDQLIALLPPNDCYETVIRYADYSDHPLKAAVIHLNRAGEVRRIAHNHKVHFFAGAGLMLNRLSLTYDMPVSFSTKITPCVTGGIFWQSTGQFEKFLNIITLTYAQYQAGYTGWLHNQYRLSANTHAVYNVSSKLSILYRALDKFKYRLYAGISGGYVKNIVKSHLSEKPINSEYFTANCFNGDALVFKAELLLNLGRYSVSAFQQLGNATDIGANDYQLNPRNSGVQFCYNF